MAGCQPVTVAAARRRTRRAFIAGTGSTAGVAAAVGTCAALLAGCATPGASPAPAASKAPVTIRYTYRAGYEPTFDEFALAFTQQEGNITVTTEMFPGADYFTKLSVLFASGTA